MSAILEVQDLCVRAGRDAPPLVNGVSFVLRAGQSLTLLGESGSGKSLLAHAIMGRLPHGIAAEGRMRLNDSEMPVAAARRQWWGREIALLPQEPWIALDPTMRALEQVFETHRFVAGLDAAHARTRARDDLARLGLVDAADKFPGTLSGGMAQRVAFAATAAGGARILIVDEPTKGLDAGLRDQVIALLRSVVEAGGIVLAISHDVAVARAMDGDVAVMLDARVVERGKASHVLAEPQHDYTKRLLAAEPANWPRYQVPSPRDSSRVLEAKRVAKRFGTRTLFEDVDLVAHRGERLAIVGASGSGKTTLGNVLLGLARSDAGSVKRGPDLERVAFQKLYQDPVASFAPRITLRRALADVIGRHRLPWSGVEALLARLRLPAALLDRLPHQVSGGELQRIALLRVLLLRPALVFADEPTSRLDPVMQKETMDLLVQVLGERGSALLLVTHDPTIAHRVADRVVAIGH